MNIETIDKAFDYFYKNESKNITGLMLADYLFPDREKDLLPHHLDSHFIAITMAIIKKLENEGNVYHYKHTDRDPGGYRITFNGKLFFENPPRPLKNRPYRYTATMETIKQIYTIAKIIIAAISTLAIIWISYLTYRTQRDSNNKPGIIVQPLQIKNDTIYIDSNTIQKP